MIQTVQGRRGALAFLHAAGHRIRAHEGITFGLVIVGVLSAQAVVLSRGFVSVSADEFSRVLLASTWAESPYFIERYILDATNAWQPWHFYLLGLALKICGGDLFLTSRIATMVFSVIGLGMLYLLVRKLFGRWTALLSVLIVGWFRAFVNLSLTPMPDVIFVTFLISFLYFFFSWWEARADGYLVLAGLMVGLASGMRYDGWFAVAVFGSYLGLRWLIGLWTTRSLRPLWLLSICLACLPICIWLLANYVYWGDPAHFLAGHKGSGPLPRGIGPLSELYPGLGYAELLLQNGGLVLALSIVGIVLARQSLADRLWLYLAFGFTPYLILTLRGVLLGTTPGTAYRPHYPFPYLVLLAPFCAYAIYLALTAPKQTSHQRWQKARWGTLALMSIYNVWIAYLRFIQWYSWIVICSLALVGIIVSYRLLSIKHWLYFTLSLGPLPILLFISRIGLAWASPRLCSGLYVVCLALFYAYVIWRAAGVIHAPSSRQWRIAGSVLLAIVCLFNLWDTVCRIPEGMPSSAVQAGLFVRRLFEEGALAEDDKVLVEVNHRNYKVMQVMSNHPRNFVLDRSAYGESDSASFLLDESSSPHGIGVLHASYEQWANPFSLDSPPGLDDYLTDQRIRLAIIKDPRLDELFNAQTEFERIEQVEEYVLYGEKGAD